MKVLSFLQQPLVLDKDYCAVSLCRSNRFLTLGNVDMHLIKKWGSQIWNWGWTSKNIHLNPQNSSAFVLKIRKMDLAYGSNISAASMFQILAGTSLLWDLQDYTGCVKIGIICSKVQMLQGGAEAQKRNRSELTGAPQNLSLLPFFLCFPSPPVPSHSIRAAPSPVS